MPCSVQHLGVAGLAEADDYCLATDQGRRAQIAGRPEHGRDDFIAWFASRLVGLHLFALGDDNGRRRGRECACIGRAQFARSRHGFFGNYPACVQNLGRFVTAGSALAEVIPVDLFTHVIALSGLILGMTMVKHHAALRKPCLAGDDLRRP